MLSTLQTPSHGKKALPRAACPNRYRIARRRALVGYERRIADRRHISYWTIQRELTDAERDPVARVVETLEAFKTLGGDWAAATAYVAEILDFLEGWAAEPAADVAALADRAQIADTDEDVVEPRMRYAALMARDPKAAASWLDALLQQQARARPLIGILRRIANGEGPR